MVKADIGIWGLAVMGENLALNMEGKGFTVAVYNRTLQKVEDFAEGRGKGKKIIPTYQVKDFVDVLARPRKIMVMVKAGKPVDMVIEQLVPLLAKGDVIIDGGNSHFSDTIRRCKEIEEKGIFYIGAGISGGEEGALKGPSIMPGGSRKAYSLLEPILTKISAHVDDAPCCAYIGGDGAGHYVKMVHNAIEYADMQCISEAYYLLKDVLGFTAYEMHRVFAEWNTGDLNSYLIEITSDILSKKDPETGNPLVEMILDKAGQKGTGMWSSQSALALGVPAPTIAEAVFARCISAIKDERVAAAKELRGPGGKYAGEKDQFVKAIHDALYASKICSYAQGFALMAQAAEEYKWSLDLGRIAMIWRGGCIIRARFLDKIKEAFDRKPDLLNLLVDSYFKDILEIFQNSWRKVIVTAVELGIAVPAFSSALSYFDSFRNERLSANLIQAQRDYFGAHTYERVDREGTFHSDWRSLPKL
ncbi:NADP-dependent phosphogluconate dehydrogenase [Planctomycetota bacterium]